MPDVVPSHFVGKLSLVTTGFGSLNFLIETDLPFIVSRLILISSSVFQFRGVPAMGDFSGLKSLIENGFEGNFVTSRGMTNPFGTLSAGTSFQTRGLDSGNVKGFDTGALNPEGFSGKGTDLLVLHEVIRIATRETKVSEWLTQNNFFM
jgi:hypothetical protein